MFEEGGLKDEGGTIDPISGNDVPSGSTQEEVRDDIPAQLSEGEFVFPADVVRYIGLQNLMQMRQQAKMGLKEMEDMGQMGNSEEATMPDDMPFDINDIDMQDEEEYNSNTEENMEMAKGGVVYAATGFGGTVTSATPNITTKASNFGNTATRTPQPKTYTPPPLPTAAPTGGFKYGATKGAAESKLSFDNLFKDAGGADEYRTYVNDAGAEIQVPFKNGKLMTGFTIPEGYKLKTEKVDTAKTQTTRVKSTRPTEEDSNDSGPSLTEQGFREGSTVKSFGTGKNNVGVTVNLPNGKGGFMGLAELLLAPGALGKAFMNAITGTYDKDTTFGFTLKGDPNLSRNFSIKEYKDFQKLSPEEQDTFLDEKITKTRTTADDEGKGGIGKGKDKKIDQDIKSYEPVSRLSYRDATARRLAASSPTPSDGDDTPDLRKQEARDNTYAPQQQQNEAGDSGFSETTSSGESFGESGYGQGQGSYGGMGDFKIGGLASKKKQKIKPKKMKRGGLASRK